MGASTGWLMAAALMLMHVATIAIAVFTYGRFMPLSAMDTATLPVEMRRDT